MTLKHFSPVTRDWEECTAKPGNCRYGDAPHRQDKVDWTKAHDEVMADGVLTPTEQQRLLDIIFREEQEEKALHAIPTAPVYMIPVKEKETVSAIIGSISNTNAIKLIQPSEFPKPSILDRLRRKKLVNGEYLTARQILKKYGEKLYHPTEFVANHSIYNLSSVDQASVQDVIHRHNSKRSLWMKIGLIGGALALLGGIATTITMGFVDSHPITTQGTVVQQIDNPAYSTTSVICTGGKIVTCHPITTFHPESWDLKVQTADGEVTIPVSETAYDDFSVGSYFDNTGGSASNSTEGVIPGFFNGPATVEQ